MRSDPPGSVGRPHARDHAARCGVLSRARMSRYARSLRPCIAWCSRPWHPATEPEGSLMMSLEERRAQFTKYKQDVKDRGKPFYPFAMFHDTVMSLVVVVVIVGLACVWYFTSGEDPNTCGGKDSCLLGPRYAEPADPGTTNFVPRPDWYFYFLFYLLRIFKWPNTVILGTVGIPTILLIILIMLPFLDLRRERRLLRRPVTGRRSSRRSRRRSRNGSMIRMIRRMVGIPTVPRMTVFGHLKIRSR